MSPRTILRTFTKLRHHRGVAALDAAANFEQRVQALVAPSSPRYEVLFDYEGVPVAAATLYIYVYI